MYELINSESSQNLNFVQRSTTRWLSRSKAVDRICSQYLELEAFFEINADKENVTQLTYCIKRLKTNFII